MIMTESANLPYALAPVHRHTASRDLARQLIVSDGASTAIAELLAGAVAPRLAIGLVAEPLHELTRLIGAEPIGMLHIVAHGRVGGFSLGGHWIDARTLAAKGGLVARWKVGTIALWSCHAGRDDRLAYALALLTGAQVLVARSALGAVDGQARWALEDHRGGSVPAGFTAPFDAAVMASWPHQLDSLGSA